MPKRQRTPSPGPSASSPSSPSKEGNQAKKLKLLAANALTSPFPDLQRPTPAECAAVHDVLAAAHPDVSPTGADDDTGTLSAAETCGRTPDVLEALIGTILSQNTSAANARAAHAGLTARFGAHAFAAIATAPPREVADALRAGGLADKKAAAIQGVLRGVHAERGAYTLQHLAEVDDAAAMRALVAFDGVGPKTAACVLMFALGRAVFPVDTHVLRLVRLLGWVPPRADRVAAQAHLDLRVPGELKRGLHVLMVAHGRKCKGCRGRGPCPLKEWLKTRKGLDDEDLETMSVKAEEEAEQTRLGEEMAVVGDAPGDVKVEAVGKLGEVKVEEESNLGKVEVEVEEESKPHAVPRAEHA